MAFDFGHIVNVLAKCDGLPFFGSFYFRRSMNPETRGDAMEPAKSEDRLRWEQQLSLAIDFYPSTFPHFSLLNSIIDSWFERTEMLLGYFTGALQKHGETIHIGMLNSARLEGSSRHFPAYGGDAAVSIAQLSLGVFPKALGLTNRAHTARVLGAHNPATADVFGAGPPSTFGGFDRWSMKDTSVGMLVTGLGTVYSPTPFAHLTDHFKL